MSGVQHACFISYKHPPDRPGTVPVRHLWLDFIDAFTERLNFFLTVPQDVYWDDALKARGGVHYPPELAKHLCQSACLVAVLVPEYEESSWCCAEWDAMEALARDRVGKEDPHGLIIPVLLRGERRTAEKFARGRQVLDFTYVLNPRRHLSTNRSSQVIEAIARNIAVATRALAAISPCDEFRLDVGEETVQASPNDPSPFR